MTGYSTVSLSVVTLSYSVKRFKMFRAEARFMCLEINKFPIPNLSLIVHFTNLLLIWRKVTLVIDYSALHSARIFYPSLRRPGPLDELTEGAQSFWPCKTDIHRAARQTMYLRKLQYSRSSSKWEATVVSHRSVPLQGKAGLGPGHRDLGSTCGLTCSVPWQCHGGGQHSQVRSPAGALRSSGVVPSSSRPLGNTDKGNAFGRLFLSQRRSVCSKARHPGKYPLFLFLAFSSGQLSLLVSC